MQLSITGKISIPLIHGFELEVLKKDVERYGCVKNQF